MSRGRKGVSAFGMMIYGPERTKGHAFCMHVYMHVEALLLMVLFIVRTGKTMGKRWGTGNTYYLCTQIWLVFQPRAPLVFQTSNHAIFHFFIKFSVEFV